MKKTYFLSVICLFFSFSLWGQTNKTEVAELAGSAELILKGSISSTKGFNFIIEIGEVIAGDFSESSITVRKYKNFKAVKRWGKYQVREDVLVFLKKNGENWELLGSKGEGEKLIMADAIYLDSRGGAVVNRFQYHSMLLGGNIYAEKVDLANFIAAVKDFRELFAVSYEEVTDKEGNTRMEARYTYSGDDAALDEFRAKSDVHNRLATDAGK